MRCLKKHSDHNFQVVGGNMVVNSGSVYGIIVKKYLDAKELSYDIFKSGAANGEKLS